MVVEILINLPVTAGGEQEDKENNKGSNEITETTAAEEEIVFWRELCTRLSP